MPDIVKKMEEKPRDIVKSVTVFKEPKEPISFKEPPPSTEQQITSGIGIVLGATDEQGKLRSAAPVPQGAEEDVSFDPAGIAAMGASLAGNIASGSILGGINVAAKTAGMAALKRYGASAILSGGIESIRAGMENLGSSLLGNEKEEALPDMEGAFVMGAAMDVAMNAATDSVAGMLKLARLAKSVGNSKEFIASFVSRKMQNRFTDQELDQLQKGMEQMGLNITAGNLAGGTLGFVQNIGAPNAAAKVAKENRNVINSWWDDLFSKQPALEDLVKSEAKATLKQYRKATTVEGQLYNAVRNHHENTSPVKRFIRVAGVDAKGIPQYEPVVLNAPVFLDRTANTAEGLTDYFQALKAGKYEGLKVYETRLNNALELFRPLKANTQYLDPANPLDPSGIAARKILDYDQARELKKAINDIIYEKQLAPRIDEQVVGQLKRVADQLDKDIIDSLDPAGRQLYKDAKDYTSNIVMKWRGSDTFAELRNIAEGRNKIDIEYLKVMDEALASPEKIKHFIEIGGDREALFDQYMKKVWTSAREGNDYDFTKILTHLAKDSDKVKNLAGSTAQYDQIKTFFKTVQSKAQVQHIATQDPTMLGYYWARNKLLVGGMNTGGMLAFGYTSAVQPFMVGISSLTGLNRFARNVLLDPEVSKAAIRMAKGNYPGLSKANKEALRDYMLVTGALRGTQVVVRTMNDENFKPALITGPGEVQILGEN